MCKNRNQLFVILAVMLILLLAFLFLQIGAGQWDYVFYRRLKKAAAVLAAGYAVAVSSVLFQTITNNRILTPSIIGFDSLYLLIQGITIFFFGAAAPSLLGEQGYFLLNVGLMIFFAELLYRFLFRREDKYIYFILLAGVVCGMLFRSLFSFFLVLLDPDKFDILQDKMFASFNLVQGDLLALSIALLVFGSIYGISLLPALDVFLLGRENAHNLGIDCDKLQKKILRIIAVLVAVSTALVGPITFLGLLVVNLAYTLFDTYRHGVLLTGSILISWAALFGGLLLVERVFDFSTNFTVIIDGIGGSYFLYLLLREGHKC